MFVKGYMPVTTESEQLSTTRIMLCCTFNGHIIDFLI